MRLMPMTTGYMLLVGGHQQRPQVLVPAVDELDDEQRGDRGRRQRQQHVLEEAHRPGAVDARRLDQLVGHGEEELAEQEGRGRRGDQRHRQAGVGVEHAEVGDHLVGREDAHLDRQHQRDEDHPEHQAAQREAEVDDRERRQQRDRDLADRDDQRGDQAHPHHAAHRRSAGAGAASAPPNSASR